MVVAVPVAVLDNVVVVAVAVMVVDANVVVFAVVGVVGAAGMVGAEEVAADAVTAAFKGAEILEKKSSCRPKTTSDVDDDDAPWAALGECVDLGDWTGPLGEYGWRGEEAALEEMGETGVLVVTGLGGRFLPVNTESGFELIRLPDCPPLVMGVDDDVGASAEDEEEVEEEEKENDVEVEEADENEAVLLEVAARLDFLIKLGNCVMGCQIQKRRVSKSQCCQTEQIIYRG